MGERLCEMEELPARSWLPALCLKMLSITAEWSNGRVRGSEPRDRGSIPFSAAFVPRSFNWQDERLLIAVIQVRILVEEPAPKW
jgi:hypothetical protein